MARAREIGVRLRRRRAALQHEHDREHNADAGRPTACFAPSIQLYFQPDGDVRACCHNATYSLGNVGDQGLREIWDGPQATALRESLAQDDYHLGCRGCEAQVNLEGRPGSAPARFDLMATHVTSDPASWEWPRYMEFNLSNACNLQCIQCNGDLSSSIRTHREGRAPLPKLYGDRFFDDLAEFLPHLSSVQFAGGEPFLASENFRVWDLMAELAPGVGCTVVTNATQWNRRVTEVLEKVPMGFAFSIDGITKGTYEAIRIDADFDEVMTNLDRYCAYAKRVGTTTTINHCLMVQNHHEFGDLLVFAEERDIRVNVSVVRHPGFCSISRLPTQELQEVWRSLEAQDGAVRPRLELNAATWDGELARIGRWAESGTTEEGEDSEWAQSAFTVLTFRRAGNGPSDDRGARAELAEFAADGAVHELSVGPDDRVSALSDGLLGLLGDEGTALLGGPVERLQGASTARFGTMLRYDIVSETEDRVDAHVTFRDGEFRLAMVAMRGESGWADEAKILIAARGSGLVLDPS